MAKQVLVKVCQSWTTVQLLDFEVKLNQSIFSKYIEELPIWIDSLNGPAQVNWSVIFHFKQFILLLFSLFLIFFDASA